MILSRLSALLSENEDRVSRTSWKAQASCVMISSFRPKAQNERPYMLWLCAAHITSGRASCTAPCIMNAAVFNNLTSPPSTILPLWSTRIRSLLFINENATPNGLTQNVVGSTGSRTVICPATPSSKPYFPNMRKAAASRPLRYSRSSYLSVKVGGPGIFAICPLAWDLLKPGSRGASVEGYEPLALFSMLVADGGAMMMRIPCVSKEGV